MNKTKLGIIFLVAAALFLVVVVHAESNKPIQPKKVKQKAVTQMKPSPTSVARRAPLTGPRQGYVRVTDVLGGFGGESESDNYRIPVNSGGQPSAIGISESTNFGIEAGFVHASYVMHVYANSDGAIGPGDIVALLNYLYRAGSEPCPMESGDANCDGAVGPGDVVFLLNYLYRDGPPPPC
jgi:hypothetical protein